MTNNELIKELVVYDGYTYFNFGATPTHGGFSKKDSRGFTEYFRFDMLRTYLTDMNILHRIAVKLVANISGMLDNSDSLDFALAELNSRIVTTIFCDPNEQGEHIQLAKALVNAIRHISANKAQ